MSTFIGYLVDSDSSSQLVTATSNFICTAVVAKAPRKNVASRSSNGSSPSGGSLSSKKRGKLGGGGNPLKIWPIPKGQKGLQSFFGGCSTSNHEGGGPSGSSDSEELDRQEGENSGKCESVKQQVEVEASDSGSNDISSASFIMHLKDVTQFNSDDSD